MFCIQTLWVLKEGCSACGITAPLRHAALIRRFAPPSPTPGEGGEMAGPEHYLCDPAGRIKRFWAAMRNGALVAP
jgi:hypothetical protein